MKLQSVYPLITTRDLKPVRDFYVANFALDVIFEANWVVILGRDGNVVLGFMTPDHPTSPPGPEAFDGKGMIVTIQVEDAKSALASVRASGASVTYDLHDEPWGQRRFMMRDPAGILVDVVEQTQPAEGFWEKYMGAAA